MLPEMVRTQKCDFSLESDEVENALACMQKSIKCYQNAPILSNEERNKSIKECQEIVIKCYLEILSKKK